MIRFLNVFWSNIPWGNIFVLLFFLLVIAWLLWLRDDLGIQRMTPTFSSNPFHYHVKKDGQEVLHDGDDAEPLWWCLWEGYRSMGINPNPEFIKQYFPAQFTGTVAELLILVRLRGMPIDMIESYDLREVITVVVFLLTTIESD